MAECIDVVYLKNKEKNRQIMTLGYIDPGTGFTIVGLSGWLITFLLGSLGIVGIFFKKIFRFIKKYKKILFLFFIIIILFITGVNMNKEISQFDKKIIILGFDGLSPEIIEPLMQEGKLPNFSRLKKEGSYKHLSTTNPSQSPVAWAAFATGQNPGKNGVFDFIIRDPKNCRLNLALSKIEKGKPKPIIKSKRFWQYSSKKKIPTIIITCPMTFPPDKIYGKMLSGMGVPDILGTEGTFTFYTTKPLDKNKDIGGKVFQVKKSFPMTLDIIGPKTLHKGKTENVKVPFKVILKENKNSILIKYQNHTFELKKGEWSNFKEVTFKLGLFKTLKGIFKFYLVSINPEFKLYLSPINFDPRKPFFEISYPSGYSKELANNIGLYHTQGMPFDTWAVNEKRLGEEPFIEQAKKILQEKEAMLNFEIKRLKKGILFCYFESSDIIQHMFWRYTDSQHSLYEENAPKEYKEMIKNWYKKMDDILGWVMDKLDKEDILIVLSDHGFNTFRRGVHLNSWLRQNGYLELKNPNAKSGRELLTDIDWSKTKAYALGFGGIYINQEGREQKGIVKPGKDTELIKKEISQKLKQWRDTKYNQPIINNVYSREDIFWGNYTNQAPDLYVGFNIGYRASWQTALGAVPEKLLEDNLKKWSGSHLFDPQLIPGVLFSNQRIIKEFPSIYDITPTILKIIGYSESNLKDYEFDGTPLF